MTVKQGTTASPVTSEQTPRPLAATNPPPTSSPLKPMSVARPFPKLTFRRLTGLVQPDDGLGVLYVTEQRGLIRIFPNQQDVSKSTVFLDITGRVNEGGNEEGLLGLAFDPGYQDSGFFYVYYSAKDPRRSVVSRFSVNSNDPSKADPDSESIIMKIPQPFNNHN